jgi:hypothetical protein
MSTTRRLAAILTADVGIRTQTGHSRGAAIDSSLSDREMRRANLFVNVMSERILALAAMTNELEGGSHASLWKLLLRRSKTGGVGGTGSDGLLSLRFLSLVVWRACKRLQPVEAGGGADRIGSRARRDVPED